MDNILIILAFVIYLGLMMFIGLYYYRKTNNMDDYIIGNRKLGAWVTSLSAEASDMSGWMLMGLPGAAYLAGLAVGFWAGKEDVIRNWAVERIFLPDMTEAEREKELKGWRQAVRITFGWAKENQD